MAKCRTAIVTGASRGIGRKIAELFAVNGYVAQCELFLAFDQADFITGQVISPNGGFVI